MKDGEVGCREQKSWEFSGSSLQEVTEGKNKDIQDERIFLSADRGCKFLSIFIPRTVRLQISGKGFLSKKKARVGHIK